MSSTESLARLGPETTPQPVPDYVWRGRGLFETYRDEILEGNLGGGRWMVPSGSESATSYVVRVGVRRQSCECVGFGRHQHCSHVVAAQRASRLSVVCDGCGERVWRRDAVEVTDDHASLTWFVGDTVCRRCARGTDIL